MYAYKIIDFKVQSAVTSPSVVEVYKYVHGDYDADKPQFLLHSGRDTRGNSLKLNESRCTLDVRANFFSQRVVFSWNLLPDSVVTAPKRQRLQKQA
jgi:hypothetical protein